MLIEKIPHDGSRLLCYVMLFVFFYVVTFIRRLVTHQKELWINIDV